MWGSGWEWVAGAGAGLQVGQKPNGGQKEKPGGKASKSKQSRPATTVQTKVWKNEQWEPTWPHMAIFWLPLRAWPEY